MTELNLTEQALKIKTEHAAVTSALKSSLENACQAGDLLSEVSRKMEYKDFILWSKKECGLSEATTNNYVRLFKHKSKFPAHLNYTEALQSLRKKRNPKKKTASLPILTDWQKTVQERMEQFKVKAKLDNMQAFLESFGIKQQLQAA